MATSTTMITLTHDDDKANNDHDGNYLNFLRRSTCKGELSPPLAIPRRLTAPRTQGNALILVPASRCECAAK